MKAAFFLFRSEIFSAPDRNNLFRRPRVWARAGQAPSCPEKWMIAESNNNRYFFSSRRYFLFADLEIGIVFETSEICKTSFFCRTQMRSNKRLQMAAPTTTTTTLPELWRHRDFERLWNCFGLRQQPPDLIRCWAPPWTLTSAFREILVQSLTLFSCEYWKLGPNYGILDLR